MCEYKIQWTTTFKLKKKKSLKKLVHVIITLVMKAAAAVFREALGLSGVSLWK